ncbi:ABC transporter, partial [Micromonospora echinofusca]|nr:ABC transporter [Micromonospora echinofusca]
MNGVQWLDAFAAELGRRGLDPETVRHVVAEAATHLRESGEHPDRTFGSPAGYASAVADSLG